MVMVAKVVGGREGNDERIILPPTAGDEMAAVLSPAIQLMPEKPEQSYNCRLFKRKGIRPYPPGIGRCRSDAIHELK